MEQIVTKIEELSGRRRLVYINGEQAFALYSTEVLVSEELPENVGKPTMGPQSSILGVL